MRKHGRCLCLHIKQTLMDHWLDDGCFRLQCFLGCTDWWLHIPHRDCWLLLCVCRSKHSGPKQILANMASQSSLPVHRIAKTSLHLRAKSKISQRLCFPVCMGCWLRSPLAHRPPRRHFQCWVLCLSWLDGRKSKSSLLWFDGCKSKHSGPIQFLEHMASRNSLQIHHIEQTLLRLHVKNKNCLHQCFPGYMGYYLHSRDSKLLSVSV